jgi:ABC-type multidrug transport system fused ATPase/permease subunit
LREKSLEYSQNRAIRIGGIDLRDFCKTDLRNHISIVSQDTFLFNDTILNNIRLGRLNATDAEVEAAATQLPPRDIPEWV